jgi:lysophospholipase L1-like esterase
VDGVAAVLLLAVAVLGLTGCGSSGTAATQSNAKTIVVAALGDSITAGSPGYDPDKAQRQLLGFGNNISSQWEYWAELKDPRLTFRNCGVYGQRTDEIALRLDACAKGAAVLVVQGGINDIAQGVPVERAAANLRKMVRRGKELGLQVELIDVLPWNNGYPAFDPQIRRLNALIDAIGRDEHVRVLPFHDTIEDPRRPGRMPDALTPDGDHPSVEGYRLLGEQAFRLP